jgi:MFS family permease
VDPLHVQLSEPHQHCVRQPSSAIIFRLTPPHSQARLDDDFEATLNLGNTDYSTAVALLTVGYMVSQLPSNMLITRVRPALYLPSCALLWSAVSAATAGVKSPGELFAVQVVLGIIEAPLFPGVSVHRPSRLVWSNVLKGRLPHVMLVHS